MARQKSANRTAAPLIPPDATWQELRDRAKNCKACDLWKRGTQTVFGEGGEHSRILFVGEQPGNDEDLRGRPFVGPAGRVLDRALEEAGIERSLVYVTNVVKHFKWEPRGKRRIHTKPNTQEITACMPWLNAEIEVIRPSVVVCLGATAAQALLGRQFLVTKERGRLITNSPLAPYVMATIHPSSILRAPDDETRRAERERFAEEMRTVARVLRSSPGAAG